MVWFFTIILIGVGAPGPTDRLGPFATKEQCEVKRAQLLSAVPGQTATECLPEKKRG